MGAMIRREMRESPAGAVPAVGDDDLAEGALKGAEAKEKVR